MVARYLASRADVRRVLVIDAPIGEAALARLARGNGGTRQDGWIHALTLEKLRGEHDTNKLVHRVFVYPSAPADGHENDRPSPGFVARYAGFLGAVFAEEQINLAWPVFWISPRKLYMLFLPPRIHP